MTRSPTVVLALVLGLASLSGTALAQARSDSPARPSRPGIPVAQATSTPTTLGPELRAGVLYHDAGVFGSNKENGVDLNMEYLFGAPTARWWSWIGSPRPHVGVSLNSSGSTSQVYAGLSWQVTIYGPWFIGGSLGLSLHSGKSASSDPEEKELGSNVLFRESIELGVRLWPQHSISVMLDHISNANLYEHNEGLDTIGVRYGYRF